MVNSKLVQLLKSLSAAEFRQFNKFIRSSFFTNSELVLKLYEYLRKHYPDFDSPKLTRERVYSHLFPKSPFNAAKLRDFSFKLTKILEDYLIYLEMNQDDFQKKKLLTHIYGKRNLNVIFKQKTTELLSHLDAQPARDATYYFENICYNKPIIFTLAPLEMEIFTKR